MGAAKELFIVAAKRTPFGTFGGKLTNTSATELAAIAAKDALKAAKISPEKIDTVVIGNVSSTSKDGAYLSRHAALKAGIPDHVPALTLNRLCGSGFQALVSAAQDLLTDEKSHVALCGGSENMSQAPFILRHMRFGTKLGTNYEAEDSLWATLTDQYIKTSDGRDRGDPGLQVRHHPGTV